jgi:hypothetical protein
MARVTSSDWSHGQLLTKDTYCPGARYVGDFFTTSSISSGVIRTVVLTVTIPLGLPLCGRIRKVYLQSPELEFFMGDLL